MEGADMTIREPSWVGRIVIETVLKNHGQHWKLHKHKQTGYTTLRPSHGYGQFYKNTLISCFNPFVK